MSISTAILKLQNNWNLSPQEINNGNCDTFAQAIVDEIPKADLIWKNGHCFITLDNKFYDSECPQGCDYPDELPFYQRQFEFYP